MGAATVRAQAKLNLFLRVTGREASGYHHLETLFCRIALADVVTVRLTSTGRVLDSTGPALPPEGLGATEHNLAWRAAVAYAEALGWPASFAIELDKQIPVSAGLAGGSADAGAVLRALNALSPRPVAPDRLLELARALGADVPFLTQDVATLAFAWRRGDAWHALPPLPSRTCLLAIPALGVATSQAYAWLDEARSWTDREVLPVTTGITLPDVPSWDDVSRLAHNDFEDVVFPRQLEVDRAWRYLSEVASQRDPAAFARMSGSGAAIFAIFASGVAAGDAPPAPPPEVRVIVTHTADRVEPVQLID
jgi:4-diphosphocytidyl-2-C-methyl-D-erythritol kinase